MKGLTIDMPVHRGYDLREDAEIIRLRQRLAYEKEVSKVYGEMATVGGFLMIAMTLLLLNLA